MTRDYSLSSASIIDHHHHDDSSAAGGVVVALRSTTHRRIESRKKSGNDSPWWRLRDYDAVAFVVCTAPLAATAAQPSSAGWSAPSALGRGHRVCTLPSVQPTAISPGEAKPPGEAAMQRADTPWPRPPATSRTTGSSDLPPSTVTLPSAPAAKIFEQSTENAAALAAAAGDGGAHTARRWKALSVRYSESCWA